MVIDLTWLAGEVISVVALMYGAYLVLMETEPFSSKRSAAPLLAKDLRLIEGLAGSGLDSHSRSGNGVIDTQHQGLIEGANSLRVAILSGRSPDEMGAIFDELIRDQVRHFQDEEEILAAADYPGTAKHAALHRDLVNSAAMLAGRFRAGMLDISELMRFLAHGVIAEHLLGADRDCIPCLEGRG